MGLQTTSVHGLRNDLEEHDVFLLLALGVVSVVLGLVERLGDPSAMQSGEASVEVPLRELLR